MAKNEALDEWIAWFRDLFKWLWIILKWTLKIIIGLIVLYVVVVTIYCIFSDDKCKHGISFKVGQVYYKMDNQLV